MKCDERSARHSYKGTIASIVGAVVGVAVNGFSYVLTSGGEIDGGGCGRFLGPELSNSKTASILHWTQTPQRQFDPFISIPLHILVYNADKFFY